MQPLAIVCAPCSAARRALPARRPPRRTDSGTRYGGEGGAAAFDEHVIAAVRGNDAPDLKAICGGAFADPAAFNAKVKVLFLAIGAAEGPGTKNFSDALTKAGVHTVYFESPETAHEWLTWRRALYEFAPRLFRSPTGLQ